MDTLTDMMKAYASGSIDFMALVDWYCEWVRIGDPRLVCRVGEMGTQMCANAMQLLVMLTW